MTVSATVGPLAARRPCREPRQLGADPGLVAKDEVLGRDALDPFGKGGALGSDIGARLLARPKGLFLRGKPSRVRVTQSTGRLTLTPVCAARRAPYSARLAALSAATICRSTAHSGAPRRGAGPRPSGLATRRPPSRRPAPNSSPY